MASPSKEDELLKLILENSPLKHWHFEEFIKQISMTRGALNKWLKRYEAEGLIKKFKPKCKFPYYTVGQENPIYQSKKRLYSLNQLYGSGLINYIMSLSDVKTAIIFWSIAKGDWYKDSDIDIFIFGNPKKIEKHKFELKLKRDIELHIFESRQEIKEIKSGLIKNVINGYLIKGKIQDFAEVA